MQNTRLLIMLLLTLLVLLIPLIAMQYTQEVNWTIMDFIVAGVLLFGGVLISETILRKVKNINYKVFLLVIVLVLVILIWIELAVGIF